MKPVVHKQNLLAIVYDADRIPEPDARILDANYWLQKGAVTSLAPGRGETMLLTTQFGPAVLRRYLRGGFPARLSRQAYVYTGLARCRPFREFDVLRRMHECGLPVPAPLAASCERGWLNYRGGLLMDQVEGVTTLAELAATHVSDSGLWLAVGHCVRKFHDSGVEHADLNARNILVNTQTGKVSLVDFDRCTFRPGLVVDGKRNLARLKRSLVKLWPENAASPLEAGWQALLGAYHD